MDVFDVALLYRMATALASPVQKYKRGFMSTRRKSKKKSHSNDLRPLLRLLPYIGNYRLQAVYALTALCVASIATLVMPIAVRFVLDHDFDANSIAILNKYFSAILLAVAILALSSALRYYYVTWLGERIVADVREGLFRHLTKLAPSFYEGQKTGEVVSRLTADTTQIRSAFSSTASIALRNGIMFLGAITMMVYTSPKLSGMAALAIPAIVLPLVTYGQRVRVLSRRAQDALADSAAFAQERLSAISTVQANTQEELVNIRFASSMKETFDAARKRSRARALLTFAIILASMGAVVGLLWYGAHEVLQGRMTPGLLGQFVLYAIFAASSLGQLSEVWGEIQLAAGAAERISELLDETPSITSPDNAISLAVPYGKIAFDNVSFSYPSRPDFKALNKLHLEIKPGETLALVGPSGGGKSTVFNLLERFNDPQSGRILVDDTDIADLDLTSLRQMIALVPQDPIIFSGTIAENIRFAKPDSTDEQVMSAARDAHVEEFALRLPDRYNTRLGERGVTLSGGQRQRVALARTILRDAPILLLDEATSALDAESEELVQQALARIAKGRTTIIIAHRLATVRNADRIVVIDRGRIVGEGKHNTLLRTSPLYAKLARLQFTAPST